MKPSDQLAEQEMTRATGRTREERRADIDAAIEANIERWSLTTDRKGASE